jgi:predicted amidohydrolase YtcJ
MEGNVGRLAPGMLADLVLLDADVARVLPETIRDARVMLTMISGRVVHDPAGLIR